MKQVKCTLPNASTVINGVAFEVVEDGVLSAPLEDAVADQFAHIPGYTVMDAKDSAAKAPAKAKSKAADEPKE